ncbi:MAG TPA: hypothetical protein VKP78_08170 [bacterium]|nr:hypothetical protein [bacterium]
MNIPKIKLILIIVALFYGMIMGQNPPYKDSKPDDSLKIAHKGILLNDGYREQKFKWNITRTIGTTLMLSFGALSYYLDQEADDNYSRYLETGDLNKMDDYYKKAKRYDRLKGISYIGVEVGFFINVWSLLKEE